jgi:hypothetical protein
MRDYVEELLGLKDGGMPSRNKKNFRSTKSGAGMTQAGVNAYRRLNPGSKLSTAVTENRPGTKKSRTKKIVLCKICWSNENVSKSCK